MFKSNFLKINFFKVNQEIQMFENYNKILANMF